MDFAKQRGISRDTITQYIRRHPELFGGHTEVDGKSLVLDQEAEKILNEKYPLHSPVELIEDIEAIKELSETRKELAFAERKISELYKQLNESTKLLAQAEAQKILLEDKEERLKEKTQELAVAKTEIDMERKRTDQAQMELSKYRKTFFGYYRKYD